MGIEIEHKYLVKDNSYKELAVTSLRICQGYISRDPEHTVRIRIRDKQGFITIKGISSGDARAEFEYEIPYDDAAELLKLCEGSVIDKTRYIIPYEGFTWEVDEFHGSHQGLVVAEIEIPTSNTHYKIPPFAGENVTGDPRYYNSAL